MGQLHKVLGTNYSSKLLDWNEFSSVRASPVRRYIDPGEGLPFSPDLVPSLRHPELSSRDDQFRTAVLAHRLYSHLIFTEHLERRAVIPACTALRFGEVPFGLPELLQQDLSKIITDEAHHADCAGSLVEEVRASCGAAPVQPAAPEFWHRVMRLQADEPVEFRGLSLTAFVCVSETIITSTLSKLPLDCRVHPAVRAVISDHARDEARHHACFTDLILRMWPELSDQQREYTGPLFAASLDIFLRSDLQSEMRWLCAAGVEPALAQRVVFETRENDLAATDWTASARPTVAILRKAGVLEHEGSCEALSRNGFL